MFRKLALITLLAGGATSSAAAEALDLRVTTDRSMDPTSIETIVKSVCKPGMSEEQRAVALWRLFNTSMFHWDRISRGKWENIATYGYSLCGTMWRTFSLFYPTEFGDGSVRGGGVSKDFYSAEEQRVNMKGWLSDSYLMSHKGISFEDFARPMDPGEFYAPGGKRRGGHTMGEVKFDGKWHFLDMHAGFYIWTADGKGIAPLSLVLGDATLVTDPARTGERFMPCDGGAPWFFYRASGGAHGKGGGKRPGGEIHPTNLRAGLKYVRYYGRTFPGAYVYSKGWERMPDWYRKGGPRRLDPAEEGWRHYGNGEVVFEPRKSKLWREALVAGDNLAGDLKAGLRGADPARPWSFSVRFQTPYIFVSGSTKGRAKGRVTIAVQGGAGLWSGEGDLKADMLRKVTGSDLTIEVRGEAGSSIEGLRLAPVFQYNYFLSPRPKPGENKIKVAWSPKSDMAGRAVKVTWTWKEKSGAKKHEKVVAESGTGYEVKLGEVEVPKGAELNPTYVEALTVEVVKKPG